MQSSTLMYLCLNSIGLDFLIGFWAKIIHRFLKRSPCLVATNHLEDKNQKIWKYIDNILSFSLPR